MFQILFKLIMLFYTLGLEPVTFKRSVDFIGKKIMNKVYAFMRYREGCFHSLLREIDNYYLLLLKIFKGMFRKFCEDGETSLYIIVIQCEQRNSLFSFFGIVVKLISNWMSHK